MIYLLYFSFNKNVQEIIMIVLLIQVFSYCSGIEYVFGFWIQLFCCSDTLHEDILPLYIVLKDLWSLYSFLFELQDKLFCQNWVRIIHLYISNFYYNYFSSIENELFHIIILIMISPSQSTATTLYFSSHLIQHPFCQEHAKTFISYL